MSGGAEDSWLVDIRIKKQIVSFKMDTGAEVTTVSGDTYQSLGEPRLRKPTMVLNGPAHQPLDVMGQFTGWLRYGKQSTRQNVHVVKGLKTNILGLQAITDLQLVCRINATDIGESEFMQQFPNVFRGLGNIGEEYQIKLRDHATLY